jgi:hypothetical protein
MAERGPTVRSLPLLEEERFNRRELSVTDKWHGDEGLHQGPRCLD